MCMMSHAGVQLPIVGLIINRDTRDRKFKILIWEFEFEYTLVEPLFPYVVIPKLLTIYIASIVIVK